MKTNIFQEKQHNQKKGYTTYQSQFAVTDCVYFIYKEGDEFKIVDNSEI